MSIFEKSAITHSYKLKLAFYRFDRMLDSRPYRRFSTIRFTVFFGEGAYCDKLAY